MTYNLPTVTMVYWNIKIGVVQVTFYQSNVIRFMSLLISSGYIIPHIFYTYTLSHICSAERIAL